MEITAYADTYVYVKNTGAACIRPLVTQTALGAAGALKYPPSSSTRHALARCKKGEKVLKACPIPAAVLYECAFRKVFPEEGPTPLRHISAARHGEGRN